MTEHQHIEWKSSWRDEYLKWICGKDYAAGHLEGLDPAAFKHFRKAGARSGRVDAAVLQDSNTVILDNLQLREGDYLRRAAMLLFHETPERFVPGAYVKIGFFRNDADLAYQDEVHGNLFLQAEKTLDLLLTKYM